MTPFQTSLELEMEKVPDFMANTKMFIRPRLYSFWSEKLPVTEKRRYVYMFDCPFEKSDTTKFMLPERFVVDSLPGSQNMEFSYENSDLIIGSAKAAGLSILRHFYNGISTGFHRKSSRKQVILSINSRKRIVKS